MQPQPEISKTSTNVPNGHLDYYVAHGISPVHYDIKDLSAHLQRREALYRSIGLPSVAFKGANVLEVAPGSGQNSLYVASCQPKSLTLVEPNPTGIQDIKASYQEFPLAHTKPTLITQRLQDFDPAGQYAKGDQGREAHTLGITKYDIVICENWLGALPEECALIKKLSSLVADDGVLVLTYVPLAGFFPNVMRKLLALRAVPKETDFETKTELLVKAFGPHLATMPNMTRSHQDWVQDCMVNPHYLNVALPLKTLLAALDEKMEILGTYPRYTSDWRWFKTLTGADRKFNAVFQEAEAANLSNFIDHRYVRNAFPKDQAASLYESFAQVHSLAVLWQSAHLDENPEKARLANDIVEQLEMITTHLKSLDPELANDVSELKLLWQQDQITISDIASMQKFNGLFGRETVYIALTKTAP